MTSLRISEIRTDESFHAFTGELLSCCGCTSSVVQARLFKTGLISAFADVGSVEDGPSGMIDIKGFAVNLQVADTSYETLRCASYSVNPTVDNIE